MVHLQMNNPDRSFVPRAHGAAAYWQSQQYVKAATIVEGNRLRAPR
jgi:hypothetical protein